MSNDYSKLSAESEIDSLAKLQMPEPFTVTGETLAAMFAPDEHFAARIRHNETMERARLVEIVDYGDEDKQVLVGLYSDGREIERARRCDFPETL